MHSMQATKLAGSSCATRQQASSGEPTCVRAVVDLRIETDGPVCSTPVWELLNILQTHKRQCQHAQSATSTAPPCTWL